MKQERNILIDVLKGFAILLVVLGHSVQYNMPGRFDDSLIFRVIYSYHMPFFIFLSGFVSFGTFDGSKAKLLKRFKSLIIPFWCWFLISYAFTWVMFYLKGGSQPDFFKAIIDVLKSPDHGLWFLWVLFLNILVLYVSLKITRKYEEIALLAFFALINVLVPLTGFTLLGMGALMKLLLFFSVGYILNKHASKLKTPMSVTGYLSLIIYPVLVVFWSRSAIPTFAEHITIAHPIKSIIIWLYNQAVPLTGILATYKLFDLIVKYKFVFKDSLISLGRISLEIYSTHFYFFAFTYLIVTIPLDFRILLTFIVTLTGTLLIQWILKKSVWLSFLLYGKPLKQKIT
jgi:fucose 4-O-acetylase-like acetyltransferase